MLPVASSPRQKPRPKGRITQAGQPFPYVGLRTDGTSATPYTTKCAAEAVLGRQVHPHGKRPRPTGRTPQVHAIDPGPASNKLLAALSRTDFQLLAPHLTSLQLAEGTVLYEPGDEVGEVYFPLSGMVSLVVVMRDGKAIETATVGREGVVGAMAGLGLHVSWVRAIVQLPMFVGRISSPQLRKGGASSKPIAD